MTIEELFQDVEFQKHLADGIKTVRDSGVTNPKAKGNAFKSLEAKGYLNVTILKYEFAKIVAKKSALSANERQYISVLVNEAINKKYGK